MDGIDPATLAKMDRVGAELMGLLRRQLRREPDHDAVEFVWRSVYAFLLAETFHRGHTSPAELEIALERICVEVRATAVAWVRRGDMQGWQWPGAGGWLLPTERE